MPVTTTSSSLARLDGLTFSLTGLGGLAAGLGGSAVEVRGLTTGLGGVACGLDVSTCVSGSAYGGLATVAGSCGAESSMTMSGCSPALSGVFFGSTSSVGPLVLAFLINRALALQHQNKD